MLELMTLAALSPGRRHASDKRVGSRTLANVVRRHWRQMVEARHTRRRLMQLDDHLLRDLGLTRPDVCFGDLETLLRHRRGVGVR